MSNKTNLYNDDFYNEEEKINEDETVKEKETDPNLNKVKFQVIICSLFLVFFLTVKMFFGAFYIQLKKWYDENAKVQTSADLVLKDRNSSNG